MNHGELAAAGTVLRAEAEAAERHNRLTESAEQALRAAGLFRLGAPKEFGGDEAGMAAAIETVAEVARACPSSSWLVGVSYGAQRITARFSAQAQHEVWADGPDQVLCGSFNLADVSVRRQADGQVLSGRWSWVSGSYQADWAALAVPVGDAVGMALVPLSDLVVKDTWNMAGLRGTGSHTLVATEVFIPDHRTLSLPQLADHSVSLGALSLPLVATMLGTAEEIFQATMRVVGSGKPMADSLHEHLADSPSLRSDLARARNLLDSAWLHVMRSANALDAAQLDDTEQARLRMDAGYASKVLREAADLLLNVGGASSFAATNPVQRYWRDLHTAARHPTISTELSEEIYGHALVGSGQQVSFLV